MAPRSFVITARIDELLKTKPAETENNWFVDLLCETREDFVRFVCVSLVDKATNKLYEICANPSKRFSKEELHVVSLLFPELVRVALRKQAFDLNNLVNERLVYLESHREEIPQVLDNLLLFQQCLMNKNTVTFLLRSIRINKEVLWKDLLPHLLSGNFKFDEATIGYWSDLGEKVLLVEQNTIRNKTNNPQ